MAGTSRGDGVGPRFSTRSRSHLRSSAFPPKVDRRVRTDGTRLPGVFWQVPPERPARAVMRPQPCRRSPGGGGQLTVEEMGNHPRLRKVRTPGTVGAGASPPGESPSDGAETTQPGGTGKAPRRRFPREMVKRPTPLEQALSDGRRRSPDHRGGREVECCRNRMRLIPATWPHRRGIGGGFPTFGARASSAVGRAAPLEHPGEAG
jgi:hypothetical protein